MVGAAEGDSGGSLGNGESIRRGLGGGLIGGRGEAFRVICEVGIGGAGAGIEVELQVVLEGPGRNGRDRGFPELVIAVVGVPGEGIGGPSHRGRGAVKEPAARLIDETVSVDPVGVVEFSKAGVDGDVVGEGDGGGSPHGGGDQALEMIWPVPDEGRRECVHIGGGKKFGEVEAAAGGADSAQGGDDIHGVGADDSSSSRGNRIIRIFRNEQSESSGDDWGGE